MSREFTVAADDDGIRVDRWFKRHMADVSFNQVSRWARTGQLRVNGARVGPGDRLVEGQVLRVPPAEAMPVAVAAGEGARLGPRPERARREVSAEEADFAQGLVIHKSKHALVLNKPPGLATQGGTKTTEHVDGLLDALQFEMTTRPKLVHRLDKDTSGVLLLARTSKAAAFFGKCFATRETRKLYWAVVAGGPKLDDAFIDLPIGKQPGTGGEKMAVAEPGSGAEGQIAKSRFRVIDRAADRAAFVEMQPMTGRTHQLRVHAAATGTPIVGDGKYGGAEAFLTGGVSRKMHLHARRLVIALPDGGELDVKADLPTHFAETLKMLGFDPTHADLPDPPPDREGPPKRRRMSSATSGNRRGERRSRAR